MLQVQQSGLIISRYDPKLGRGFHLARPPFSPHFRSIQTLTLKLLLGQDSSGRNQVTDGGGSREVSSFASGRQDTFDETDMIFYHSGLFLNKGKFLTGGNTSDIRKQPHFLALYTVHIRSEYMHSILPAERELCTYTIKASYSARICSVSSVNTSSSLQQLGNRQHGT